MVIRALVTTAAILVALPARAQEEPADARALFEAGATAYAVGRFDQALVLFQRSYDARRDPALLFDIALTHERLGDDPAAVTTYERYLDERRDAPNRARVEERIRMLRDRIDAASAPPLGAYVFAVSTVGLVVLAGGFWLISDAQYAELEESCAARGCTTTEIKASSVQEWDLLTNLALGVAGLTAVASAFLFIVHFRGRTGGPSVALGPGSIALHGAF